MNIKPKTIFAIALSSCFAMPHLVAAADIRPIVVTASGNATSRVMRAKVRDGILRIELRFDATTEPYGGEIVYTAAEASSVRIVVGGKPLAPKSTNGGAGVPSELSLGFSYDITKNPRVGGWVGEFEAPPLEINEVTLNLPNLPSIEHIPISR